MSERIVATDGREGHWLTGEEIVRCGDCRWRKGVVCGYFDKITWVMDFCSHGTRRTE